MHNAYINIIFKPLYNGLVGLMDLLPWIDLGVAVVIFTVLVKLLLFHLSKSSIITQIKMREAEPEVNQLKAQYPDRQVQATKIMEFYRTKGIKPFAGFLLILVQLPILFALLSVFYKIIPTVQSQYLYSFISLPNVHTHFLGLIDLTHSSLVLALFTGIAQFVQLHYSLASRQYNESKKTTSSPADIAASMNKQMKFLLPIFAFISIYWIIPVQFPQAASIVAIYWTVSALFTLGQELVIRKQYVKSKEA